LTDDLEVDIQQLYVYPGHENEADDDEIGRLVDDYIDLEPLLRDAVVLALPLAPVCRDDCPGLCPDCGARLADVEPDHGHEQVDPRWAALRAISTAETSDPKDLNDLNDVNDQRATKRTAPDHRRKTEDQEY
jgi:uncharacterized metal-binding protein YceD (DUF177 family)